MGFPLLDFTSLNHRLLSLMEQCLNPFFTVFRLAHTSLRASCTKSEGKKEVSRMFEYVRWCSWLEDLAFGSCSKVLVRTRRYSEKKLLRIFCFLGVNGNVFSKMYFLKTSPMTSCQKFPKGFVPIPPLHECWGLLGGFSIHRTPQALFSLRMQRFSSAASFRCGSVR